MQHRATNAKGYPLAFHNRNSFATLYNNKNQNHLKHPKSLRFEFSLFLSTKKWWRQRMWNKSWLVYCTYSWPILDLLPLRVYQCFHGPAERHTIIVSVAVVFCALTSPLARRLMRAPVHQRMGSCNANFKLLFVGQLLKYPWKNRSKETTLRYNFQSIAMGNKPFVLHFKSHVWASSTIYQYPDHAGQHYTILISICQICFNTS